MNPLIKKALVGGLVANRQLAQIAANTTDWLFKRDTLIKSGRTWFELVHDSDLMAVRYYELPDEDEIELPDGSVMPIQRKQHHVPLIIVPPLGVTTETFDLMPQRSLVKFMVAAGFKVYLIDWGKPRKEHRHLDLADYSHDMMGQAVDEVRRHAGVKPVSLMGWCMGGLFCLLYQGQALDRHVRNIVTVASPIDLESGSGVIAGVAGIAHALDGPGQLASKYSSMLLDTLDPALLSTPPWLTTLTFKLTDPLSSVTSYWDLMTHLYDREFVESHSTTSDYLNNMLLYPGGVLRDMAVKVVGDNQLAKGRLQFGDSVARLDEIRSNFLGFAGEGDKLVPPTVAECIADVIASDDKDFRIAPGGHMGVIIGSKAVNAVWSETATWLAKRSGDEDTLRAKVSTTATAGRSKVKQKVRAKRKPSVKRKAVEKSRGSVNARAKGKAESKAKSKAKGKAESKARSKAQG